MDYGWAGVLNKLREDFGFKAVKNQFASKQYIDTFIDKQLKGCIGYYHVENQSASRSMQD